MSVDASGATISGVDPTRLRVAGAIKQAAVSTGASFEYLLATAKMESNFNPRATATTSSARGLYQFIDQTWLGTVKEAGAQLGYGQYAAAITRSSSGLYSVGDPSAHAAIMKLRDNPEASSAMAAVLTKSNSFKLTGKIGRRPTDAELYMAHFMGVGGAARLILNAEDNPGASGARLFPKAASANRPIFFDRSGRERSVSEVYSVLTSRYASAANSQATRSAMASVGEAPTSSAVASAAITSTNAAYLASFPEMRPAQATTTVASASPVASGEPVSFQPGERAQPLSSAVHALWGRSTSLTSVTADSPASELRQAPEVRAPRALDLFSDRSGTFSG